MLTKNRSPGQQNQYHQKLFHTFSICIMVDAWPNFEGFSTMKYFFSGSILSPKMGEKVLTSVNTFGCRTTSPIQCSEILDCTALKSNISAFRKVLRHRNRFTSQRERSKNVRFIFLVQIHSGQSNTTYFNDL